MMRIMTMMNTMTSIRTYSELIQLDTFEERFRYLKLDGTVGESTFGTDRYINQMFYNSDEWKELRRKIIIRDNGCDLGVEGFDIHSKIYIHHMNPISVDDILQHSTYLINPEYLICTKLSTHNAIHYGDDSILLSQQPTIRRPNDTCPWHK